MPTDNTAVNCGHHVISRTPLGWWCVSCGAEVEGWPDKDADRDALADALIAWAADIENVRAYGEFEGMDYCIICRENISYVGSKHTPNCLHERAKALRGGDESTRGSIEEEE